MSAIRFKLLCLYHKKGEAVKHEPVPQLRAAKSYPDRAVASFSLLSGELEE
jgi:hypothetical protein